MYTITTPHGVIVEHQRHECTRRATYLRSVGVVFTVTHNGRPVHV